MEISRAWADDSNDVSHLSKSHLYGTLNPKTDREGNFWPYFFLVEISRAWADDSNDVSHLSLSHL